MAGYLGASPVPQTIQKKETITATAGQTTFNTTGYTDGNFINVFLNGVRLVNGTDYTATNGSDIVLGSAAAASDVLDFETFNEFQLTDQEFADSVIIENNTSEDSDGGRAGKLVYKGKQSGGEQSTLAEIQASHDGTADDQKADLIFRTNDGSDGASPTQRMKIDSAGDLSLYEDTGATAKFSWDASAERLGLTGSDYQFYIQQGSNQPWYNRAVSDGSYRLHLNGTGDIITASSSGDLTIEDGNLVIGTSGHGIDFSADSHASGMQSEVLNDYEEGTCTLSWSGTGTQGPDNSNFKYVRVGSLVSINGSTGATLPNPTGSIGLTGLPFVANGNSAGAILFRNISAPSNQIQLVAYVGSTASEVQPYWAGSVNYVRLTKTDFNSSVADMYFSLNYRTT